MGEDQLRRLQEVVVRATQATSVEAIAQIVTQQGIAALGAGIAGLWLLGRDRSTLELVHWVADEPAGKFARMPINADAPLAVCVRERAPVWIESSADYHARFPASARRLGGEYACACVPLIAGDEPIGGAVFAFPRAYTFAPEERIQLLTIARACAAALERVRLVESERVTRVRAEQLAARMRALQAVAARLSGARTAPEITRILIDEAFEVIGATDAAVWLTDGNDAVLAGQLGMTRSQTEAIRRITPDDPGALGQVLREHTALWFESRSHAAAAMPEMPRRWGTSEAMALVPLVAQGRLHGIVGIAFDRPVVIDPTEREFVELFAAHAAQALARDRDESSQRLLADAGAALASSLDYSTVLARLGQLTVASFADWCMVDLVRDEGWLERVVVAHADPSQVALAARLRRFLAPHDEGVARSVQRLEPVLIERVTDELMQRIARDDDHLACLRELAPRSTLSAPMVVGGRAIGGISWVSAHRTFDARDAQVAEQLARAAAAAIDNARLYAAQEAAARRGSKLYELSAALSSARTPDEIALCATHYGVEVVEAKSCAMWLRAPDGTLHRASARGMAREWEGRWIEVPASGDLPMHRVIAARKPLWVESPREYDAELDASRADPSVPFVVLPLEIGGECTGVLAFGFHPPHRFTADERTLIATVTRACEQALERAQLYANESSARAVAETASRTKDQFLAMLGHELRNPLAPISTALDLMRLRGVTEGERERAIIERQVQHLTRLVDDLLDISRITRGKIELRRTRGELAPIVESAIEAVGPLVADRRQRLTLEVPVTGLPVAVDTARISQVIRNLVTNAVKFTPPGGHVRVAARGDGDRIELEVTDDGPGIAPELLPRVFDMFVQGAQGAERSGGGLGLGLAIVKNLVEAHGGNVVVGRVSGAGGTRVTVQLPRDLRPADPPSDPPRLRPLRRALRVLVVDDNADAALILGELLRSLGHEPMIAHDGAAALATVGQLVPQLAILDIGLPDMSGYELAGKLRLVPGLAGVPLVALTGYGQPADVQRSHTAGFAEHLVKPIDLQRLDDVLGRVR